MEILVLNIYLNPFKDDEETWNWGEILTDLLRRMDLLHTISEKKHKIHLGISHAPLETWYFISLRRR